VTWLRVGIEDAFSVEPPGLVVCVTGVVGIVLTGVVGTVGATGVVCLTGRRS
jgi:hypothetical protein